MGNYWVLIPVGVLLAGLLFAKRPFIVPNVKLNWHTLKTLLRNENEVEKIDISEFNEYPGALVQMQFRDGGDSVKYFRTEHEGRSIETIDVLRPDAAGFIATFVDEVPSTFTRIGGTTRKSPEFPPGVQTVLLGLLRRVRAYAED